MSKYYDGVDETTYLLVEEAPRQNRNNKNAFARKPPLTMAEKAYRSRWVSIRLIYMLTFMNYISYTATLASLWAYLKVLDSNASASTMGWVVSAYAMGQIVSGPLFGFWANRRSIKEPLVASLILNLLAYIFYMYLASLPSHRDLYMIVARWLIGFSSASIPLARTYVANATTLSERTPAIANTNICGAVGFILGPLVQAASVPISYPGPVESLRFHFNMYTAPILLAAVVSFVTLLVILLAFTEHSALEDTVMSTPQAKSCPSKHITVDYVAVVSCVVLFFCSFFNFVFLETIIVPEIMDMFAWTKAKATLVQSLTIGGMSLISIVVYIVIKWLSKRIKERALFLTGFLVLVLSYVVMIPWGHLYPAIQMADIGKSLPTPPNSATRLESALTTSPTPSRYNTDATNSNNNGIVTLTDIAETSTENVQTQIQFFPSFHSTFGMVTHLRHPNSFLIFPNPYQYQYQPFIDGPNPSRHFVDSADLLSATGTNKTTSSTVGCPWQYAWCQTMPAPRLVQFVLCCILFAIGYPTTNLLAISIFTKILGPKPMGLWMGVMIASGCVAGMVGPVLQTILYDRFGPQITFMAVGAFMIVTTISVIVIYKRLRPYGEGDGDDNSMNINNKG